LPSKARIAIPGERILDLPLQRKTAMFGFIIYGMALMAAEPAWGISQSSCFVV
jgi:hypothetical protein